MFIRRIYVYGFSTTFGRFSLSLSFKDRMRKVLGALNPDWWFSKKRISFDSKSWFSKQSKN
jgi:hypothetical protein